MRRVLTTMLFAGAFIAGSPVVHAQGDGGYRLVPNWPKLPDGMYFGLKDAPPPPAERDAQAAARRARGGNSGGAGRAVVHHAGVFVVDIPEGATIVDGRLVAPNGKAATDRGEGLAGRAETTAL